MARLLAAVVVALCLPAAASASITLAYDAQMPALRVDARGNAEVSWTARGRRQYLLVPPRGRVYPGRRIAGRDVSRATTEAVLPYLKVLRRTPDGRLWALQAWRPVKGARLELHLARWRGEPTQLTLSTEASGASERVLGEATFQGRAVTGSTRTPEGRRLRIFVYVDASAAASWRRLAGVAPRTDGTFALVIRPEWRAPRYRATLAGPNIGATLAPDAAATADSALG